MPEMGEGLEALLRGLIRGEYSSLALTFNEDPGPNYESVAACVDDRGDSYDWVSEEEKQKAVAENSMWVLQWYPDTPVGFCRIAASSVPAIMAWVRDNA